MSSAVALLELSVPGSASTLVPRKDTRDHCMAGTIVRQSGWEAVRSVDEQVTVIIREGIRLIEHTER